jgi:putative nucleotide binding protein
MEKRYEEHAYVLDFLQHGKPGFRPTGRAGYRAGALIQCVGEEFFTLLEALVKEELILKPGDCVYVGKDSREEVTYIIGRIGYEELTASAKAELPSVISKIVASREKWFVNFFNTTRAITPRMHALELVPGIGKKYMWQVINQRERKPFESFDDLQKRTELPNPVKLITKRIMEELEGDSKYRLFTRAL